MHNNKVIELNLEYGMPNTADALSNMTNALLTLRKQGCKAVILIHGYGSSGTGGSIKSAVRKRLGETSMSGVIRAFTGGEQWSFRKSEFLRLCGTLQNYERRICGNDGVTVAVLK